MQSSDNMKPSARLTEMDPRFPSGEWVGFWIQRGSGRQTMSLHLWFGDGLANGVGSDIVGRFTMQGTYDLKNGRCHLNKQYQRAHRVQYEGNSEGDELWLWGIWQLRQDRGGFHIWPKGANDPTLCRANAAREIPLSTAGRISLVPVVIS
jgi:hypothetical protein